MNNFLKTTTESISSFVSDEDGAQVIEYALILAVVSLIVIVALAGLTGAPITDMVKKVIACMGGAATCT